jgi:hypothetical protein
MVLTVNSGTGASDHTANADKVRSNVARNDGRGRFVVGVRRAAFATGFKVLAGFAQVVNMADSSTGFTSGRGFHLSFAE